uniref:Uncharacterized protein n=1 Tax=Pararge aegeria TaxID=116150 RepID=S4PS35_9NEOP
MCVVIWPLDKAANGCDPECGALPLLPATPAVCLLGFTCVPVFSMSIQISLSLHIILFKLCSVQLQASSQTITSFSNAQAFENL